MAGHPTYSCKRDQIKMKDYMARRVTPPKRVTSPTWGPPSPCKQALRKAQFKIMIYYINKLSVPPGGLKRRNTQPKKVEKKFQSNTFHRQQRMISLGISLLTMLSSNKSITNQKLYFNRFQMSNPHSFKDFFHLTRHCRHLLFLWCFRVFYHWCAIFTCVRA